eukprot:CAMPEP_0116823744 /NCGR_PEP_ID=MMETSP0418-20121206/1009_1 /TAXON_ID=1158023 /ORGANISM="Astrosyne radiata, Strain 13vi08-1A" /LENGTH=307 /DNA_ID=CAMNT_0004452033 /DNA_START=69 /DNA_END=992 /DNA_ORIENTATION=+
MRASGQFPVDNESIQLQVELDKLRESTRVALMQSWAEVEQLQEANATSEERNLRLETQLEESLEREANLQKQLKDLQRQLNEATSSSHSRDNSTRKRPSLASFLQKSRSTSNIMTGITSCESSLSGISETQSLTHVTAPEGLRRIPSGSSQGSMDESNNELIDSPTHSPKWNLLSSRRRPNGGSWGRGNSEDTIREEKLLSKVRHLEEEKNDIMAQCQMKLECRDSALQSMEVTTQVQGESLVALRNELQQTKARAAAKESMLCKQMDQMKRKIQEKRRTVSKQQDKIEDLRDYIDELSAELDNLRR